jgi:integrase
MNIWIETKGDNLRLRWRHEGKRYCLGLDTRDNPTGRALVKQKIDQIEMDMMAGYFDPTLLKYKPQKLGKNPTQVTAVELFEKYAAYRQQERELSHSSQARFKGIASKLAQFLGDRSAARVNESVAHDVVARWSESVSSRTVKEMRCDLSACWDWAKGKYHVVEPNPWSACLDRARSRGNTTKSKQKKPFTIPELQAIIAAFSVHPQYRHYTDFVTFLASTGCRPGEAAGLRWKHLDSDFSTAWIGESISRGHHNQVFNHSCLVRPY